MELTWDKGYMDYEDPAWEKRMQILKDVQNSTSAASAQGMDGESLLNYLEKTEELLRYYAAERDFQNLENLMRKYEPLLPIAAKKKSDPRILVSTDGIRASECDSVHGSGKLSICGRSL